MTDVCGHVDTEPAAKIAEEVAETTAMPVDACLQRLGAHPFDATQHQQQPLDVVGPGRCKRETAVAGEERRDAVPTGRRRGRVPVELRVVMRVHVDEAGSHEEPVGVDDLRRVGFDPADPDDLAIVYRDVGSTRGRAGAVDDRAAANDRVEFSHGPPFCIPYSANAFVPNNASRAAGSIPSDDSRSSSTTPGYFASLCGKSLAHTKRSAPTIGASTFEVISPGSKLIQHCRWKYSRGVNERPPVAQL